MHGWHMRTACKVIRLPSNTGSASRNWTPLAVQSVWRFSVPVAMTPLRKNDALGIDTLHTPKTHDILHLPQCFQFRPAYGRTPKHRRQYVVIEPQQLTGVTQQLKQVLDGFGFTNQLHLKRSGTHTLFEELAARLEMSTVDEPRVPRHDPADSACRNSVIEQPKARVDARLAGTNDDIAGMIVSDLRQPIRGNTADLGGDFVLRRMCRGHRGVSVGRVYQFLSHVDAIFNTGHERQKFVVADVVAQREIPHAPRRQELLLHALIEVTADLVGRSKLMQPSIQAGLIDGVSPSGLDLTP